MKTERQGWQCPVCKRVWAPTWPGPCSCAPKHLRTPPCQCTKCGKVVGLYVPFPDGRVCIECHEGPPKTLGQMLRNVAETLEFVADNEPDPEVRAYMQAINKESLPLLLKGVEKAH